jgi:hypothetical protein
LAGRDLSNLKKIDEVLLKFQNEKIAAQGEDGEKTTGKNVLKAVSEAISYGVSACYNKESLFKSFYKRLKGKEMTCRDRVTPRLMFTLLNGGKSVASKVKFAKIYLIFDDIEKGGILDKFRKI